MAFGIASVVTNLGKAVIANRIKGTGTEPNNMAFGSGATAAGRTALVTDTGISAQYLTRVAGTSSVITTTTANDTYQVVGLCTANSAVALDEMGLFDASTGGNMFGSDTFAVINLADGDSLQLTRKTQFV